MVVLTRNMRASSPAWSPEGTRISFIHSEQPGKPQVFMMNSNGSGVAQLSSDEFDDVLCDW
jgi:Tol biopolymer transport system component